MPPGAPPLRSRLVLLAHDQKSHALTTVDILCRDIMSRTVTESGTPRLPPVTMSASNQTNAPLEFVGRVVPETDIPFCRLTTLTFTRL